ncbi:MAG: hypothetical protein AMXMBFR53_28890 [Gemmatimonadota bacterium]
MAESSNLPRLYDEKEVGKLLKRATELQQEEGSRTLPGGGLSLTELEDIAAEAGIDPRHLRRAAAELSSGGAGPEGWERMLGERLMLVQEAVVPGELDGEGFERVVAAIQRTAREHGQPNLLGRTLTWQAETASKTRTIQVTVTSRQGETHIRAEERLHQLASGLFAGVTLGGGMGLGLGAGLPIAIEVLGSALLAVAFPVTAIGFAFLTAKEIYRNIVRRRRTAIAALTDAVVTEARDAIADRALAEPEGPYELPRG